MWAGIAQSVQRLATGQTVRGSHPGGGEIFRILPDWPWGPSSLLYKGYRVIPGGKGGRVMALTNHPHLAPRLKKEYMHIYTTHCGFVVCSKVNVTFTFTFTRSVTTQALTLLVFSCLVNKRLNSNYFEFQIHFCRTQSKTETKDISIMEKIFYHVTTASSEPRPSL